jgi:hypothetical protein
VDSEMRLVEGTILLFTKLGYVIFQDSL